MAAYRIAVEAALNVVRHTGLRRAELSVDADDGTLRLRVRDGGPGIGDAPAGVGILAMRERAEELGGTLVVRGERGTVVEATLPLAVAGCGPVVPEPESERRDDASRPRRDHPMFREGLRFTLERAGVQVVGEAATARRRSRWWRTPTRTWS